MIIENRNINKTIQEFDRKTIKNLNEQSYIDQKVNEIETSAELKANVSVVRAKDDMLGTILDIKR